MMVKAGKAKLPIDFYFSVLERDPSALMVSGFFACSNDEKSRTRATPTGRLRPFQGLARVLETKVTIYAGDPLRRKSMQTQVRKWGNSLAIRIPGVYARDLGLREGMEVDIALTAGGLVLRPARPAYSLEELVRGITPENRHGETDWGSAEGLEAS
jgi:antitoxin MazE